MHVYDEDSHNGLLLRSTDNVGYTKGISMLPSPLPYQSSTVMEWRHYPENNKTTGRSYTPSYDVRLQPMMGDWFDAAKRYRTWLLAQPWAANKGPLKTRADFPQQVAEKTGLSLYTVVTKFAPPFDDLVESHEEIQSFFDNAETISSHFRNYGILLPNPEIGTLNPMMIETVNRLSSAKILTMPYTNTQGWPKTPYTDIEDEDDDILGTLKNAVTRTINNEPMYNDTFSEWKMCPGDILWRNKYNAIADTLSSEVSEPAFSGASSQYCDLYPKVKLCFSTGHGHPVGGGWWWIDGYRQMMQTVRDSARIEKPDFSMTPEHRSEIGIDLFDYYSVNYWANVRKGSVFRGTIKTGIPTPIIAAAMHDYIGHATSISAPYATITSQHFRFGQAHAFVNGNILTLYAEKTMLVEQQQYDDYKYLNNLIGYRKAALDYLLYGEYMRPPNTGSGTQNVTMYGEDFVQPIILGGAFRDITTGSLGIFMTNYTRSAKTADFEITRNDYAFGNGTYEIYSIKPGSREFYGGFRGTDYTRKWIFQSEEILMLEIVPANDTDNDGMSDWWEAQYGISDTLTDFDGDGLSNLEEFQYGTDPTLLDTDSDGDSDSVEVASGSDPRDPASGPL